MSNIQASSSSSSSSIIQAYNAPLDVKPTIDAQFSVSQSATPAPEAVTPVPPSVSTTTPNFGTPSPEGENGQQQNGQSSYTIAMENLRARISKRSSLKQRTPEEEDITAQTAIRIAMSLAADHIGVLYPDAETPFIDAVDVVRRLLPYHVFQHPKEDFIDTSSKGKRKATEEDLLREEIAETKFALECWRRRKALEDRFKKARINSGRHIAPDDQTYVLTQAVVESERAETASVNAELRSARAELDRIEREKKASAPPTPAARQTQMYYSSQASTPTSTTAYSSNYRGYTYPYSPVYGTSQYSYDPTRAYAAAAAAGTQYPPSPITTTNYQIQTPSSYQAATPSTAYTHSTASSPVTPSSTAATRMATTTSPATMPPMKAIPVQLPVASLPALVALGIKPVAPESIPSAEQPQPAAILRGTSQNGAMLNLEINVASLQSAQMSGLALILNALTSRGVNVDGAASNASTSTNAAAVSTTPIAASSSNPSANGTSEQTGSGEP